MDLIYYWLVSNVISLLFVMLTVSPYLIVKSLRESMHGKCVVSQQVGNIVAYFSTSVTQFLRYTYPFTPISQEYVHKYTCVVHGFVIQFVTLSTFTWMAVMTFDVWWVFSYPITKKESKGKTSFRFKFYSLFAWGLPILILGLTWLMGYTGTTPVTFSFKPNAGHTMCFFQHSMTLWLFLYGPTSVLVTSNTVLLKLAGPLIHKQQEEEEEKKENKEKEKKEKDKKKKKKKDEEEDEDQESLGSFPMDEEEGGDDDDSEEDDTVPDQDRYYMYLKLFILNLGHLLLPIFYYPGCVWYIPVLDHTLYGIIAFLILVYNDTILDSIKPRKEGDEEGGGMMGGIEQVKVMGVGVTEAVDVANTVKGEIENLPLKDAMDSAKTIADDYNARGVPEGTAFEGIPTAAMGNLLMAPPTLGYPVPPLPPQMFSNYAVPNKKGPMNRAGAMTSHPSLETDRIPRSQFSLDEMRSLGNPLANIPTISSTLDDGQIPQNIPVQQIHQQPLYQAALHSDLIKSPQTVNLPAPDSLPSNSPSTIESSPNTLKTVGASSDEDA